MDELVKAVVQPLVDHPGDVQVTSEKKHSQVTYILTVNKEDMGKVIGKRGRMAAVIRTVVHAAGLAHHENVSLSIRE